VLGGDVILTSQGITILTIDDLIRANRAIRDAPRGQEACACGARGPSWS